MKSIITTLMFIFLIGCSTEETAPPQENVEQDIEQQDDDTSSLTPEQSRAMRLLGTWSFTYTINKTWTDVIVMDTITTSTMEDGEILVLGVNGYGAAAYGGFSKATNQYMIISEAPGFDEIYSFGIAYDSATNGCYYMQFDDDLSDCYPMTGYRQ